MNFEPMLGMVGLGDMNFEPMLGMMAPGDGVFVLLVVAVSLFCVFVVPTAGIVAIVYFIARRAKTKPQPTPIAPASARPVSLVAAQAPLVASQTVVMPRACPQCGAALQPDTPEGLCPACLLQRGFATEGGAAPGQPSFVPPPIDELARLFPQLEILECLGRGGMGAVYKARQPRLDRFVALKILAPEKQSDPQFAERFEREARVLARLSHPNIVSIFDFGEVQGRYYLLMEYVDGLTLRQVMQAGKISSAEALDLVPKICEALQYAHGQGIVHRDIKPENILLDKQGHLKIADFGIAKIAGLEAKGLSLTGARDVMGTPAYMAPEQVEKPQTVDHRADIYSLGVVFYEMLTGELPLGKFAPPSKKVQLDVRLDEVVLHALEKEPALRYQQASQVKTAVETIAGSPPPFAPAPVAAAALLAGDNDPSDKIILPAFLLAFFFGPFGAHRFYVGKVGTGLLQLFTCGGLGIWATIDWILLACKVFTDADGRRMTNWIHAGPSLRKPVAQASLGEGTVSPIMPHQDLFWRRFAIVVGCIILIPMVVVIIAITVSIAIPAYWKTSEPEKTLTAQELQQAGIHQDANGEFRKDSTQTFPLDANGRFSIDNVDGRIAIHGSSSNAVVLAAVIHGKTAESVNAVKFNVESDPSRTAVHTKHSSNFNAFEWSWAWFKNLTGDRATVDYTVQLPEHARLADVRSVDGNVIIDGMAGDITVSTVDGGMQIKGASHNLNLHTVDGSITAEMSSLGAGQSVSLHAVDGQIALSMPEDADATISASTVDGGIRSEFPSLQPNKDSVVGHSLNGSLGGGGASVTAHAVDGGIRFLKIPASRQTHTNAAPIPVAHGVLAEVPEAILSTATNHPPATTTGQLLTHAGAEVVADVQGALTAVTAAQKWLVRIDAGEYSESWKEASVIFQGGVTEPAWENSMNTFRKPLGVVVSRQLRSSQVLTELPGAPDGQYVVMQFDTSFANKKSAVETVTFDLESDEQWKSSGYFIK